MLSDRFCATHQRVNTEKRSIHSLRGQMRTRLTPVHKQHQKNNQSRKASGTQLNECLGNADTKTRCNILLNGSKIRQTHGSIVMIFQILQCRNFWQPEKLGSLENRKISRRENRRLTITMSLRHRIISSTCTVKFIRYKI
jgi:hypothetical protein